MMQLKDKTVVVAGGTGNVAGFVVAALLARGATVAVPSRSAQKLANLRDFLIQRAGKHNVDRLKTFVGDLSDESEANELRKRINDEVGPPNAVLASLGQWRSAPSLLTASVADLEAVLQGYLIAHFKVARTFLPEVKASGGTYLFINGPLAFDVWPGSGSAFVSIATAGQHMLFRALAQELEGSPAKVVELVTHAFIRNRQTQPGSPIPGEAVGAYAAYLLSGAGNSHAQSVQLRSPEQLEQVGIELANK